MAAKSNVRVAMVGAGAMANSVHYPSLASFPDVVFAGICDTHTDRLNATADKYGIERRYADYRTMIKETTPNAVYVIGPPDVMYPIWTDCLQRSLNLCIEKPMGLTLHQARSLAYLAEKHGCITQVSFQRRSSPMVTRLYEECRKRGPIVHAVCEFYKCAPEPMLGARDHMMDDGVHAIDTLRWLCGGEVVGIDAVTQNIGTPDLNLIIALLRFDNGATGILMNSWTSGRRTFRVQFHAPGICAEAEHETKGAYFADGDTKGVWRDAREDAGGDELYQYGGFQAKNREFIDAVKTRTQPPSCFADALKTMEVAEKILAKGLF